jgi:hypothetical protein
VNVQTDLAKCQACGEVFKASELAEQPETAGSLELPAGSRIVFQSQGESRATIQIPQRGLRWFDAFPLAFVGFWLAFITVWTILAAIGNVVFALFSIPFWLVGLGMLGALLNVIRERQTIELRAEELEMRRERPLFPRRIPIRYDEITSISLVVAPPRDPAAAVSLFSQMATHGSHGAFTGCSVPVITHGTRQTRLAEHVSEPEMKWLVALLKTIVRQRTGRKV